MAAVCTSGVAAEHLLQFWQMVNLAKRLRGRRLAPSGASSMASTTSPKVAAQASKVDQAAGFQAIKIEETLQRIHFDHRVADGGPVAKVDAVPRMLLV